MNLTLPFDSTVISNLVISLPVMLCSSSYSRMSFKKVKSRTAVYVCSHRAWKEKRMTNYLWKTYPTKPKYLHRQNKKKVLWLVVVLLMNVSLVSNISPLMCTYFFINWLTTSPLGRRNTKFCQRFQLESAWLLRHLLHF